MQLGELAHRFLVERLGGGCLVEIEIAAEHFIGPFAREHHLDAHRLDDAGQQVHGRGGADCSHVVGLDVVDDIPDCIEPLLDGVVDFVVNRAQVVGYFARLRQVGGTLEPHGKGVETRPPCGLRTFRLHAALGILPCHGRNHRTVQAAREQHAVGHVAHQLALHGRLERFAYHGG